MQMQYFAEVDLDCRANDCRSSVNNIDALLIQSTISFYGGEKVDLGFIGFVHRET
jgi:hypothetical protein